MTAMQSRPPGPVDLPQDLVDTLRRAARRDLPLLQEGISASQYNPHLHHLAKPFALAALGEWKSAKMSAAVSQRRRTGIAALLVGLLGIAASFVGPGLGTTTLMVALVIGGAWTFDLGAARSSVVRAEGLHRESYELAAVATYVKHAQPLLQQHMEVTTRALANERAAETSRRKAKSAAENNRILETERKAELARVHRLRTRPTPPPEAQPFGVSHRGAESLACAWMRHLGVADAEVTQYAGDGGIDVDSMKFVAQVKNLEGSVPVAQVREIFGVATAEGKHALLFTSGTLSIEGIAFADRVGMAVFRYDAEAGELHGVNVRGVQAVGNSIPEAFK